MLNSTTATKSAWSRCYSAGEKPGVRLPSFYMRHRYLDSIGCVLIPSCVQESIKSRAWGALPPTPPSASGRGQIRDSVEINVALRRRPRACAGGHGQVRDSLEIEGETFPAQFAVICRSLNATWYQSLEPATP